MKNAEYGYALIANVDLVHKNIWQPPHDPFSCSRSPSWPTRIRKITQDIRCLANTCADPRSSGEISLIDILVNLQEL